MKTKTFKTTKLLFLALVFFSSQSYALDLVLDPSALINTLSISAEAIDQTAVAHGMEITQTGMYAKQGLQYAKQLEQYYTQLKQLQNQSGSTGMGALLPKAMDAARGWAPASWQDSLKMIQSGVNPGGGSSGMVSNAVNALKNNQNVKFSDTVYENRGGLNKRGADYYDLNTGTAVNTMGLAEVAYSTADERTANIETLSEQIDQQVTEKGAIDLQNRLVTQQLHQQNQMIQLLAAQAQSQATQQYGTSSTKASEAEIDNFHPKLK